MRRKRLQHHTDIFCDMFSGWKIVNDMKSLVELESGIIEFDFLNKTQKLNNAESKTDFNMFYEISEWFTDDLKKHNIGTELIKEAKVKAEFIVEFRTGKKQSRTKGITELYLNLNSWILTDEKEYKSEKKQTQEFHHIKRKEKKRWVTPCISHCLRIFLWENPRTLHSSVLFYNFVLNQRNKPYTKPMWCINSLDC